MVHGFTDHDRGLSFDGIDFRADTGMTARAVQQSTGLSVDNSEVIGALSDPSISEADVQAGLYDRAEVRAWLVNWQAPHERVMQFRGTMGEITRSGGSFRAELRGLAEALNQPRGRVYQSLCPAVLGDSQCQFDLDTPGFVLSGAVLAAEDNRVLRVADPFDFAEKWFSRGTLQVTSGAATGQVAIVKSDRLEGDERRIELWETLRAPISAGDDVRVEAGCDKRPGTCRIKFNNFLNFRGFPNTPGEDWLVSYPQSGGVNDGGSFRS